MTIQRPRFELTRVDADGTSEAPEIVAVGQIPWATKMERRGFLGVGIGVASLLLLMDGKAMDQRSDTQGRSTGTKNDPVPVPSRILFAHEKTVKALAISPDGKILASASADETIKLWSLPDGKLLTTLKDHRDPVAAVAITPDGKILASASLDHTIKLWSLSERKLLRTLSGHTEGISAIVIHPNGKTLISGSQDNTIRFWQLPDGNVPTTLTTYRNDIERLVISPDGTILGCSFGYGDEMDFQSTIALWSLPDKKQFAAFKAHDKTVSAVSITPDGKTLISGASNIKLWSLPENKLLATFSGHEFSVNAFAVSPDGKTLVSGSVDQTIKVWSLPDGKLLATLEGHKSWIKCLAITPDGRTLLSGDLDGAIILWELEKPSFLTFLFDPTVNRTDAISYNVYDQITGRTITFTLPCGSPVPPGAVCTCNCVPGTQAPPTPPTYSTPSGIRTYCSCNKVCTCIPVPSDCNVKENFESTDQHLILQRLSELPLQKWNYKWDDASVRHIGPMAQDFAASFGVGDDDKHINPVDAQGVAFAAIQALYQITRENHAQIQTLQAQLLDQREENKMLNRRVRVLEGLIKEVIEKRADGSLPENGS